MANSVAAVSSGELKKWHGLEAQVKRGFCRGESRTEPWLHSRSLRVTNFHDDMTAQHER